MDLRNLEVAVDREANMRTMGPSGTRKRMETSSFLKVGGSSDIYSVTVNFDSKNGHYCQNSSGTKCQGWGSKQRMLIRKRIERDKRNPEHWCKHVNAALADVEKVAEAQELSAQAFGKRTATVTIKEPVAAFDTPEPEPVKAEPTARERLAVIEAEAEKLREILAAEEAAELRTAIATLLERFPHQKVQDALDAA